VGGYKGALIYPDAAVFVRQIVHHAVTALGKHLIEIGHFREDRSIMQTSAISPNKEYIGIYPIVSNVSIHYRCSDNIKYGGYGLLPFPTILSLIPAHAKYIYVHTEGTHKEHICAHIILHLFQDIVASFPNAIVVVFGKENIYSTMYNFIETDMVLICSSSTFCLHAALGKRTGKVYIPPVWYDRKYNFANEDWHYLNFMTRTEWPDNIFDTTLGRTYVLDSLKNLTLYFDTKRVP